MNNECLLQDRAEAAQPVAQPITPPLVWTVYAPLSGKAGFHALEPEWNALVRRSRFNSIFLTYEWQTTWWEALGQGDLWIVALRCPHSAQLVGIGR